MVKLLLLVFLLCSLLNYAKGNEEQKEVCKTECDQTEYTAYLKCFMNKRKNLPDHCTENICNECDCKYCKEVECEPYCKRCCFQHYCNTPKCCEETCHSQCKSVTCKIECVKTCTKNFSENLVENSEFNDEAVITNETIVIQNTSFTISIPTNTTSFPIYFNDTNVNITISNGLDTSNSKNNSCCTIISAKQCVPYAQYPFIKCFHLRKQACGPQCKTSTVHEQHHEICTQTTTGIHCMLHNVFIPQPEPNCIYQPYWPYVSCGIQQQPFCGGCYAHYNKENFQSPPPSCPFNCYDDGYGVGPYYRQGPFYRPGYAHAPSCYQVGTCNLYDSNYYFGNSMQPYPYLPPPPPVNFYQKCAYPPHSYDTDLHVEPIYNKLSKEVDITAAISPANKRHAEITIQNVNLPKNNFSNKTEK